MTQVSMVPNLRRFWRQAVLTAGTLSLSQRILEAEKYGLTGRPHKGFRWFLLWSGNFAIIWSTTVSALMSDQAVERNSVIDCYCLLNFYDWVPMAL